MEAAALATPPPQGGQYKDWHGTRVPPSVFEALMAKYRGQNGIGPKQAEVLGFFFETARLKGSGQASMPGGGGGAPTMTREKNVETGSLS